jgi:hypothetical protein
MNRLLSFRQLAFVVTALTILRFCPTASAAPPVPFRGSADLMVTGAEELPPAGRRLTAFATGQATHLGRFTRTETVIVDLSTGTFTGTLEFVAANGDRLNADLDGHFTSPTGESAEGTYVFTGGTGRFQNASGEAAFEITADGMTFDVSFSGTIQY